MSTNSRIANTSHAGVNTKGRTLPWVPKSISRTRQDIRSWNNALNFARQAEHPQNWPLQLLYSEMEIDALVSSQKQNRKNQVFVIPFTLKNSNGEVDEKQTAKLKAMPIYRWFTDCVLDIIYKGYNLVELEKKRINGKLTLVPSLIPSTNVVPQTGRFYPDYGDTSKYIEYRNMREYGTWILEFCHEDIIGLLNKVVSHVLFKRFAQSCWSELCEIYGIPPRVLKTNTQDPTMLKRAEKMMRDMGAASWFIIDDTEEFEFAKSSASSGDVYKNLIDLCRDEICLAISGAIMGQDTKNGSRSKDEVAWDILWQLVKSDMSLLEAAWNNTIIPALVKHGVLSGDLTLHYEEAEDLAQLWTFVQGLLSYYDIDPKWIKEKFGVEVTGPRKNNAPDQETLKAIMKKLAIEGPAISDEDEAEAERVVGFFKQVLKRVKKTDPDLFSTEPGHSSGSTEGPDLMWLPPEGIIT